MKTFSTQSLGTATIGQLRDVLCVSRRKADNRTDGVQVVWVVWVGASVPDGATRFSQGLPALSMGSMRLSQGLT